MRTGTLKKFFSEKGFGFIMSDDGTPDLFAPKRTYVGDENAIREGMKVSFDMEIEDRTNKPKASRWSMLDPNAALLGLGTLMNAAAAYGAVPGMADPRFSPYGLAGAAPMLGAIGMPPALPPGWETVTDPSTGKPYYCNRATGESSWTFPTAPVPVAPAAAPAAAPLPVGWESMPDPATGKTYYFNRATGQSSWEPPPAAPPQPAPAPVQPAPAPAPVAQPDSPPAAQPEPQPAAAGTP